MRICREGFMMITAVGFWRPISWSSNSLKDRLYNIFTILMFLLINLFAFSEFMFLLVVTSSVDDFTDTTFLFLTICNDVCKASNFFINRSSIIGLMKQLLVDDFLPKNKEELQISQGYRRASRYSIININHLYYSLALANFISLRFNTLVLMENYTQT